MTADADAPTRAARRGRSPFELLRFSATPVPGALVVVEIEGRVAAAPGRFARRPVLVVEPVEGRPRLELAPSRSTLDGDRWQAAYAIPAEAYDAARFALGVRGTLLDLPAPDEPSALDRQTVLAREANALRREIEAAEAAAESARADAIAAAGELGAAVSAARDEALAESATRVADLEAALVEAHRHAAADADQLRAAHEQDLADATAAHEEALAAKDRALADADARHEAELGELRATHEAALAEQAAARDAEVARLQARHGEDVHEQQDRRVADAQARAVAAEEGIEVLRAELAEERERSQGRIAELEQELVAATRALDPADTDDGEADQTRVMRRAAFKDPDQTQVLGAISEDEVEDTRPFTAGEERAAAGEDVPPLERGALPRKHRGRGAGAWVAVAALVAFVLVLLVLLGFLG